MIAWSTYLCKVIRDLSVTDILLSMIFSNVIHVVALSDFLVKIRKCHLFCYLILLSVYLSWRFTFLHVASIVSNITMNTCVQTSVRDLLSVHLGKYSEVELLDYIVILFYLFFLFWGIVFFFFRAYTILPSLWHKCPNFYASLIALWHWV